MSLPRSGFALYVDNCPSSSVSRSIHQKWIRFVATVQHPSFRQYERHRLKHGRRNGGRNDSIYVRTTIELGKRKGRPIGTLLKRLIQTGSSLKRRHFRRRCEKRTPGQDG